ncbi:MAG: MATE family efflux transporter [Bacteroidota bacterium]
MNKQILKLAIPNILSNLSVPLLGMVDTALMGHLDSAYYLGAIAIGSIVFNFIYWGFGFLRMGTTGLTAQAFGKEDQQEVMSILGRGLLVALGGSLIVILLHRLIGRISFFPIHIGSSSFSLIQGEPTIRELANTYFMIRIWAAPATLSLYALQGWFLGMQNVRYPMWLTIIINAANILFSFLFVYKLGMTSDGVALGTVCAQYLGLICGMYFFFNTYRPFLNHFSWDHLRNLEAIKHFFLVNSDIFIRTICLVLAFSVFTSASAAYGATILAANQVLLQYFHLMGYAVDGFAHAAESLVGRFTGAGESAHLRKAIRLLLIWGVGLGLVFVAAYALFGTQLLALFTDQPVIIKAAKEYLPWMFAIPVVGSIAFMWDGVFIGATASKGMRNTMLLSTFLIFLPALYLGKSYLQNHGIWLAMLLFMLARAVSMSVVAGKWIYSPLQERNLS